MSLMLWQPKGRKTKKKLCPSRAIPTNHAIYPQEEV
jgi:hypothetical protein